MKIIKSFADWKFYRRYGNFAIGWMSYNTWVDTYHIKRYWFFSLKFKKYMWDSNIEDYRHGIQLSILGFNIGLKY